MTFRTRLVLAAFYVLTAVVLALVIPLALTVERRAESDFRSAVLGDAAILAARVADFVPQPRRVEALVEESADDPTRRIVVVDAQGRVVADSQGAVQPGTQFATDARPELQAALFRGLIDTRKRASETVGDELLLVTVPVVDRGRVAGAVRVSASTEDIAEGVRESWLRLAALGVAVIAAGLVLAWLVALPLSRQIRKLSDASTRLGRGELDARAPEEGPQELEALARSFNRMADSLGGNIEAQREFVANASHQLRTPLTGMRLRLEAIREEGGFAAEQAEKAEADLERLSAIVDDLLALAGASSRDATAVQVDLAELARDAAARWRPAAEAAGTRVELGTQGRPVAWADRGGSLPRPRQPRRQRDPVLARGLGGADRGAGTGRFGSPARFRHRARHPARGARACLRALLPRDDGAPGGAGLGSRAPDRRRARRALGRRGPPPRRPRNPHRSGVQGAAYRTLTIALPGPGQRLATVAA